MKQRFRRILFVEIKMRCARRFGLVVFAFALLTTAAGFAQSVEPGKEGELARLVEPQDGARACFSRTYGAKHLQSHPDQRVTRMDFRLTYYVHEPDRYWPEGQRNYYFQLLARTRDEKGGRPLSAMGECSPSSDGKNIWCGVECDGGGVVVRRRDGGKLLVDLAATGRIRMTEGCGEEDGVDLLPGKDDKTFLLGKLSDGQCPVYENW